MTPTISDVAARANVSVATASRALSGVRPVSESNLKRVVQAAEQLNYRPNLVAAALRKQVTDTIGLVVPQISNPFFPALVESVEWQLQSTTRQLLLCDSRGDADLESQRLQALLDRQVDGIMISPSDARRSAPAIRTISARVPLVQLDRRVTGEVTDWVGVDDEVGMGLLINHLATVGTQSAAFVGAEPTNSSASHRLKAFKSETKASGLRTTKPLLRNFTTAWGVEAAQELLTAEALPDAIVCGNDLIAIGVLRQLFLAGIRVPYDVLVTGFDDIPSAELSIPSLTTVRQPHEAMAFQALRLLSERFEKRDAPYQRISLTPDLIIRQSTMSEASVPT